MTGDPFAGKPPEERFAAAGTPEAAPLETGSGTIFNTPAAIERYKQMTILTGLKLKAKGITVTRGRSIVTVAREQYGLKSRRADAAYQEMRALMVANGVITEDSKL